MFSSGLQQQVHVLSIAVRAFMVCSNIAGHVCFCDLQQGCCQCPVLVVDLPFNAACSCMIEVHDRSQDACVELGYSMTFLR